MRDGSGGHDNCWIAMDTTTDLHGCLQDGGFGGLKLSASFMLCVCPVWVFPLALHTNTHEGWRYSVGCRGGSRFYIWLCLLLNAVWMLAYAGPKWTLLRVLIESSEEAEGKLAGAGTVG